MIAKYISSELILSILKGLGYKIVELKGIGKTAEVSPKEGLLYAVITGHGYLDATESNYLYKVSRDFFRIFNQISEYEFQNGLFVIEEKIKPFNTLLNIFYKKNYLSKGNKYILPIKVRTYNELLKKCSRIITLCRQENLNPHDVIVCPLFIRGKFISNFESFMEFLIVKYFSNLGYGKGTPDAMAFKNHELVSLLNEYGFLRGGGNVIELMCPSLFGFVEGKTFSKSIEDEFIVFEVKTGPTDPTRQLRKYLSTGYFDIGVEAKPFLTMEKNKSFFTFNREGEIKVNLIKGPKNKVKQFKYLTWLNNYLKYYILANLDNDKFCLFVEEILQGAKNRKNFIEKINQLKMEILIKQVISYM